MGPRSRCSNQASAPPAQDWQNPLPALVSGPGPHLPALRRDLRILLTAQG